MVNIYDMDPFTLNQKVAEELGNIKDIVAPEWAAFVKTGTHKARVPHQENWWHLRSAALLISVAKLGPIGTNKLRVKYGGRKRRGHKPAEFRAGSGNIIRTSLQQLEKAGLVKSQEGDKKGRVLAPAGQKLLAAAVKALSNDKKA